MELLRVPCQSYSDPLNQLVTVNRKLADDSNRWSEEQGWFATMTCTHRQFNCKDPDPLCLGGGRRMNMYPVCTLPPTYETHKAQVLWAAPALPWCMRWKMSTRL